MSQPDPDKMPRGHFHVGQTAPMTSTIRSTGWTPPTYFRHAHTTVYRGFGIRHIQRRLYDANHNLLNGPEPVPEEIRPGEAIFRPAGTYHSVKLVGLNGDSDTDSLSCDKDFGDGNTND